MIHKTVDVSKDAVIGENTNIWHHCHVREFAHIGTNCTLGKNVYIDHHVSIGNNVKIQNNVSVFHGVTIEDNVFVGPHVCFTNDKMPRAVNHDGTIKRCEHRRGCYYSSCDNRRMGNGWRGQCCDKRRSSIRTRFRNTCKAC